MWECLQNCSLCLDSAESSALALSSASYEWSVRRPPPPPPPPSLSFTPLSALCHSVQQEAFFVTDMMLTVVTEGNWKGWAKAEGGKSVHCGCMYIVHIYNYTYVCMYVHMHRHAVTKWSTDRLHSYCSAQQFSNTACTRCGSCWECSRESVGHALHRTHCQCFSFLAAFSFQQHLVDFRPFLRSEVIHAGRWEDRVCCNIIHTTLPPTTRVARRDWGGEALCH